MLRVLSLLCMLEGLAAWQATVCAPGSICRAAPVSMAAEAVIAKKAAIVDEVKATMEDSALMFCVRSEGLEVNDINQIRMKLPEGVTMRCVKNTLVKRATEDFPRFQGGDELLAYSNYWFFAPEDKIRGAVETWTDYIKEAKKEDNDIVGGIFEGEVYDQKGVVAITKLPTKQELMQTTAVLLKALPTKLARTLNEAGAQRIAKVTKQASGQKLVQAVKAMEGKKE